MRERLEINGKEVPGLCFGTGITNIGKRGILNILLNRDKNTSRNTLHLNGVVKCAISNGCNMFDTSSAYGTSEYILGQALKKYPRDSYYIVTKICNKDQYSREVRKSFFKSLKALNVEYIDLYLMHWPVKECFIDTWKEMEKLYNEGLCKAIGVCNFNIHHFEELKKYAKIMPMVNQIECHPLFTQEQLREYCKKNNIQIMAYTSTARNDERLRKTALVPIAKKYNKTITQVVLKWHQQIGNIPIFNTTNKKHLLDNININDFELTEDEIQKINDININSRLRYDPDNCDFTKL